MWFGYLKNEWGQTMTELARNYFRCSLALLSMIGFIVGLQNSAANAYSIVGQEIYYHGGAIQIKILPKDAAFTSQIYLHTDSGSVFLGTSMNTGSVMSFDDPSAIGLNPGEEFILGIHVDDTGNDFVMGPSSSNLDGVAHAAVNYLYSHVAIIGFEDLFGGGDFDYNDVMIRVAGNIGIRQVPEPSALLLVGAGLVSLVFCRRRMS